MARKKFTVINLNNKIVELYNSSKLRAELVRKYKLILSPLPS